MRSWLRRDPKWGPCENSDDGHQVEHAGQENRTVLEERLIRRTAFVLDLNQVDVAKDAIEYMRKGQEKPWRWARENSVKRVADDRSRGGQALKLIQERGGVLCEVLSVVLGVAFQQDELSATLVEAQKKGQETSAEEKSSRQMDTDDHSTGSCPPEKACCDHHDVDNHVVFEEERVAQRGDEIGRCYPEELDR